MLQVPEISPDEDVLIGLNQLQQQVDAGADYPSRVTAAKKLWSAQRSHVALRDVKQLLIEVVGDSQRCSYCEDSLGTDLEHIWPKSLYPERVFDWLNFLFACGRCNGYKGSSWAIYTPRPGAPTKW